MTEFKSYPKPEPKEKKQFGYAYWNGVKKKSMQKMAEKKIVGGVNEKDSKFYIYLWKVKDHFCEECGKELKLPENGDCRDMAHHILNKKSFPYFRWDERNIAMLCGRFGCHGKAESAISYPKMKIYPFCEQRKKELLESVGITYESKIGV